MFEKNFTKQYTFYKSLSAIALFSFTLITLAACGDDNSTGSGSKTPGKETVYVSVDDLPECTASNAESLVDVVGDYYTCAAKKWENVLEVAKGVCNIRPCDKSTEGKWIYAYSEETAYQCKSGAWKGVDGSGFDELDFVKCFMDALVRDSVASAEDLKNCTEKREGDISVVGKNMVACFSEKWVEIPGGVVSEEDLPDCSGNGYIYVMGKMAVYQCKEGVWYDNGKAVKKTSTDVPKSSSSQSKNSQSSSSGSDKTSSNSKEIDDDGTKVRGVCQVTPVEAAKGETVTYSFYNMGGSVVSYTWTFDESASVSSSDEAGPSVSYSRGGTHRAKLVINKDRKSESDEIVCPGVHVAGTAVKNCTCNSDDENLVIREGNSANVTWTVSGCTGGSSFVYEWEDDVVASGASASKVLTETGRVQPSVTVINDDGESVEVVCSAITVSRPLSATCQFSAWGSTGQLSISNVQNPPTNQDKLEFSLIGSNDADVQTFTIEGFCYDGNCSFWGGNTRIDYVSPRYDLVFEGDTICTYASVKDCSCNEVELVSGSNELTESNPVQYRWTVSGCQDYGAGPLTYSWYGDNYEADDENPKKAIGTFTERGRYYASVKVTNSLGYSMTATCARASVTEAPYVETDLEDVEEVLSAGSYAIYSYVGGRSWLTWADEGEEIPDDLRNWFEQGLDTITTVEKLCGDSVTYQAYTINVSYPVLLTVPEGKSLALRECVLKGDDDE